GVALDVLDRAEALASCERQVLRGDVVLPVDERLWLRAPRLGQGAQEAVRPGGDGTRERRRSIAGRRRSGVHAAPAGCEGIARRSGAGGGPVGVGRIERKDSATGAGAA